MDYNTIQILLKKYWTGETSLKEENILFNYFNQELIDKRLIQHQPIFKYIKKEKKKELSTVLNSELIQKNNTKIIPIRRWKKWTAAASIILMSGLFIWNYNAPNNDKKFASVKEIQDPELAYQITKEALMLVSSKLNKGAKEAAGRVRKVKEINRYVKTKK
ncbi:MAG: hypothetical protein ACI94Y_000005 [Maribacter sp.]|jgi:hypothetical protein